MTNYFKCMICGRTYRHDMGNALTCCFCKRKFALNLWPVKVEGTQNYVLWTPFPDIVSQYREYGDHFKDMLQTVVKDTVVHIPVLAHGDPLTEILQNRNDVLLRSIHRVDNKPVFYWGYHKFLWGTFAKYPNLNKAKIICWMTTLFPDIQKYNTEHYSSCFACVAVYQRSCIYRDKHPSLKDHDLEKCELVKCPLQWLLDDENQAYACVHPMSAYAIMAARLSKVSDKIKYAIEIKNLSLISDIEKYYTIDD